MFLWHSFYAPNHQGDRGNVAFRWFLGLALEDKVSHSTTYGKNYSLRFQDKGLIKIVFSHILDQVMSAGLMELSEIFIDGTHIKATANNHKYTKQVVEQKAKFMSEQLEIEIELDRKRHAKMSLKPAKESEAKPKKISTIDPESGWFHKGEHKEFFAYNAQVSCDQHGWALAYSIMCMTVRPFLLFFLNLRPFRPIFSSWMVGIL